MGSEKQCPRTDVLGKREKGKRNIIKKKDQDHILIFVTLRIREITS